MTEPTRSEKTGFAAIAGAAFAVACCAGGPLLVAAVGSLTVGAIVGVVAGVLLLMAACGALYLRHRAPRETGRLPRRSTSFPINPPA